jgi:S-DNA-T family DNA segregation ATPase FtsK/SpoIIIE
VRLTLTVVDPVVGDRADVLVDADDETSVGVVARSLRSYFRDTPPTPADPADADTVESGGTVVPFPGPRGGRRVAAVDGARLFLDGRELAPEQSLRESSLHEGALVSLDDDGGCALPEPVGLVEVRVTSGPGAGAVHRLGLGDHEVGRAEACEVRLADVAVPELALRLVVGADGTCTVSAHDGVSAQLDREPLLSALAWRPGVQVVVGSTLLELASPTPPDAALQPSEDGAGFDYNRPPRLLPPVRQTKFRLPSPPHEPDRRPLPILMAMMPLAMCVVMVLVFQRLYYLMFGLLTPLALVGNHIYDRRIGRRLYRRHLAEYRERKQRIEADAQEALATERGSRRSDYPDPSAVLLTAVGPRRRLWERRRHDPDHLLLRIGTADLPSEVFLDDPEQDEHRRTVTWTAPDVPVTVPLRDRGVLGVAGRGDLPRSVARWLVAQSVVLHSPADLQIYVLTELAGRKSWDWVRWLPHCRPAEGQDTVALVGTDIESASRRVAELAAMVGARTKALRDTGRGVALRQPDVLVVLDGARRLRSLPGLIQVLKDGPAVGIYAICLDADERLLPEECQAVVVEEATGLRVQQAREATVEEVRGDLVTPSWCARVARSLAPVRDVGDDTDDGALPASSRLLAVLQLEPPTADAIAARWAIAGRTTEAVVGESFDGPFAIDLRRDGPHGLIAGTTGSGKSELLQTLVASLAVANRPDAMTFVLVDYKGGSAFKDCVLLPHTVGMVTDLDPHLVERALDSLSAELRRREHMLARVGAKDIEDYTDLLLRNPDFEPMPRLLIVIDEFASMARELPDFVTGLVNIAQRGRSLGIHLVLATQRPSGVVSPEIRANTNLRIALRVTDASESTDVIDASDAGRISKSTPGRAYVRLGHASLVPFQAGRVGGRRPGATHGRSLAPWVVSLDWSRLSQPAPARPMSRPTEEEITDLKVLVEAINGASRALAIPPQHSPWLPALPDSLTLDELVSSVPTGAVGDQVRLPPVPYALEDLPGEQMQGPAAVDFSTFGHLFVVGAPRTGRSQLLRTLAGSVARSIGCADVHIYGIDCGSGALLPLNGLPHCGAVVSRTQVERATRLIVRLGQEVNRRQELLAERGYADLTEQRTAARSARGGISPDDLPLPHVLVLLDRWEGFTTTLGEVDGGRLTDEIMRILREGASVGIHLVLTGDRTLLSSRISTLTEDKLVFRLADRTDFTLAGMNPRKIPDGIAPGRGFRAESGVETHVALLVPDASGQGQAAALAGIGAAAAERDRGVPQALRPFRVDVLPSRLSFREAWAMRDAGASRPLWGLVGVGGDELAAYGPDLGKGPNTFVVAGPAKSGRSTVLLTMARSFLASGAQVVVATPRTSPLRELAGQPGIRAVFEGAELREAELGAVLDAISGPVAVVVDDAELLRDCDAKEALRDLIRTGVDRERAVVIGGNADDICGGFSGWQVDAKKARQGALLCPQSLTDGDLVGVRVPRSLLGGPVQPGRALVHLGDGELVTVQVPVTRPHG